MVLGLLTSASSQMVAPAEEDDGFLPRTSRPVPRRPPRASAELLKAAHDGEVDLTAALLRRPDVDASASDEFGRTALHEAVRHERLEVLQLLLDHGVDVDQARQSDGCTALMTAARDGAVTVLGLLLEAGADWRLASGDGEMAADMAQAAHQPMAVAMLELWGFEHGTPQERARLGTRQLMEASNAGDSEGVTRLLAAGDLDVNSADEYGRTALNEAARHSRLEVIDALLEAGADINLPRPIDGWTALITAAYHGATAAIEKLLEAGADWTVTNEEGRTALEIAQWPWRTALEFEKWQAEKAAVQLLEEAQAGPPSEAAEQEEEEDSSQYDDDDDAGYGQYEDAQQQQQQEEGAKAAGGGAPSPAGVGWFPGGCCSRSSRGLNAGERWTLHEVRTSLQRHACIEFNAN